MPPEYSGKIVGEYSKVCQIDYGADTGIDILDGETSLNSDFMPHTYFKFLSSERFVELYKKKFTLQLLLGSVHYKCLGYPRFDLLKPLTVNEVQSSIKTIAWLPRWKVDKDSQNNFSSHFMDYVYDILDFMNEHTEFNLIIRPHPLMFMDLLNKGVLSQESLEELKMNISERQNIVLDTDKDYLNTLNTADLLIADFSALIVEFFVSGKPIIYCNEIPTEVHSSMTDLYNSLYYRDNWQDIQNEILEIAQGNDAKRSDRMKVIERMVPENLGDIGKTIYECVKDDFKS